MVALVVLPPRSLVREEVGEDVVVAASHLLDHQDLQDRMVNRDRTDNQETPVTTVSQDHQLLNKMPLPVFPSAQQDRQDLLDKPDPKDRQEMQVHPANLLKAPVKDHQDPQARLDHQETRAVTDSQDSPDPQDKFMTDHQNKDHPDLPEGPDHKDRPDPEAMMVSPEMPAPQVLLAMEALQALPDSQAVPANQERKARVEAKEVAITVLLPEPLPDTRQWKPDPVAIYCFTIVFEMLFIHKGIE